MAVAPTLPGEILLGKYLVEREIGSGGMGVVVVATHIGLEDQVAIKFLKPQLAADVEVVSRFLREARAARKIRSDHVVRVTDVGRLEDGSPYMVMEYLNGEDLAAVVAARGGLPVAEAVEYVLQACDALAEAHSVGIVHRDLKPANLFLTRRRDGSPRVKVLDFGISKMALGANNPSLTRTSGLLGSPLYMSPEQLQSSRDVDWRSDLWSLGVVLYELLAAAPPFMADELPQLCVQILTRPPRPIALFRNDVPPMLEQVMLRCLEKDKEARWASVDALVAALRPFAARRAAAPTPVDVLGSARFSGDSASGPAPPWMSTGEHPSGSSPRGRVVEAATTTAAGALGVDDLDRAIPKRLPKVLALLAGLVLLVLAGGAVALFASDHSTARAPAAGSTKSEDEEPTRKRAKAPAEKALEAEAKDPSTTRAAPPAASPAVPGVRVPPPAVTPETIVKPPAGVSKPAAPAPAKSPPAIDLTTLPNTTPKAPPPPAKKPSSDDPEL